MTAEMIPFKEPRELTGLAAKPLALFCRTIKRLSSSSDSSQRTSATRTLGGPIYKGGWPTREFFSLITGNRGYDVWASPAVPDSLVVGQFDKEASQTRDDCVAKNATQRAARLDPSLRKKRLFRMTIKLTHYRPLRRLTVPSYKTRVGTEVVTTFSSFQVP